MTEPRQEMPPARVLVVDNEKSMRTAVRALLIEAGYAAETAEDAKTAGAKLSSGTYDVVVSDIVLSSVSGIALLQRIRATAPDVQVIMMTGEPTVDTAAGAVRAGASDYLAKPVTKKVLLHAVTNALRVKRLDDERRRLADENRAYQVDLERRVHERTRELEEALGSWLPSWIRHGKRFIGRALCMSEPLRKALEYGFCSEMPPSIFRDAEVGSLHAKSFALHGGGVYVSPDTPVS